MKLLARLSIGSCLSTLGLAGFLATSGCKTTSEKSEATVLSPGGLARLESNTSPILRQCQWPISEARQRRVVFHRTSFGDVKHTVNRDQNGFSINVERVMGQTPKKGQMPLPTSFSAPESARCASVSAFKSPTTLKSGDKLLIPFSPLPKYDQSGYETKVYDVWERATFIQQYVTFVIFETQVKKLTMAQTLLAHCGNKDAMAARQEVNSVFITGVFEDVDMRDGPSTLHMQEGMIAKTIAGSPAYTGGTYGDDLMGITPNFFMGWPMDWKPTSTTFHDSNKRIRQVYSVQLLQKPFGEVCSDPKGKNPDGSNSVEVY